MAARGLPFAILVAAVHCAVTCRYKGVEDDRPVSRFVCNKSYDALTHSRADTAPDQCTAVRKCW